MSKSLFRFVKAILQKDKAGLQGATKYLTTYVAAIKFAVK